MADDCHL